MAESKSVSKPILFLQKHRFSIFFFAFLTVYHILIVNMLKPWKLNELVYSTYCVDFSFGFASKLLPGAVFRGIFGPHANRETATLFATLIIVAVFAGVSVIMESFMHHVPEKYLPCAVLLTVIFLSGPYTFSIFTRWLGLIDTYWLVFLVLFFAFIEHKWLRFFIPFIYAGTLMIHFSALVFIITIFSIILLYRISVSDNGKDKKIYTAIFAVSICVTVVLFFILILNESKTVLPLEEFMQKLQSNGTDYLTYYQYSFFRIIFDEKFIPESVNEISNPLLKFFYLFYYQVNLNIKLCSLTVFFCIITTVTGLLVFSPLLAQFIKVHVTAFKVKKNPLRRFCAFLMIAQMPFIFILALLFGISLDVTRYYTYLVLGAFICFLTVIYYEEDMRNVFFERFNSLRKSLAAQIFILAYFMFNLMPCFQ